jgi:chemotaxis protein methyltransferase CheR
MGRLPRKYEINEGTKMDFTELCKTLSRMFDIDTEGYKENQLKRRIEHLIHTQGFQGYEDYIGALKTDQKQRELFLDRLTINVSEFFRNANAFEVLEKRVLPALLKTKKKLKIWSAACSNGAEPYSVAIILKEISPLVNHQIDATDIDKKILEVAKTGCYKKELLKNVPPQRLKKYFVETNNLWCLGDEIKEKVKFRQHDLLKNDFPSGYDLIICRNVAIYFNRESQKKLYEKFFCSLNDEGILFTGATEYILNHKELGFEIIYPWFYKKQKGLRSIENHGFY